MNAETNILSMTDLQHKKSVQNERVAINEIGVKGFRGCFTGKPFLENDRRTIFQK